MSGIDSLTVQWDKNTLQHCRWSNANAITIISPRKCHNSQTSVLSTLLQGSPVSSLHWLGNIMESQKCLCSVHNTIKSFANWKRKDTWTEPCHYQLRLQLTCRSLRIVSSVQTYYMHSSVCSNTLSHIRMWLFTYLSHPSWLEAPTSHAGDLLGSDRSLRWHVISEAVSVALGDSQTYDSCCCDISPVCLRGSYVGHLPAIVTKTYKNIGWWPRAWSENVHYFFFQCSSGSILYCKLLFAHFVWRAHCLCSHSVLSVLFIWPWLTCMWLLQSYVQAVILF